MTSASKFASVSSMTFLPAMAIPLFCLLRMASTRDRLRHRPQKGTQSRKIRARNPPVPLIALIPSAPFARLDRALAGALALTRPRRAAHPRAPSATRPEGGGLSVEADFRTARVRDRAARGA